MRILAMILAFGLAASWAAEDAAFADDRLRRHAPHTRYMPRLDLERIARFYGPRTTIPGVTRPRSVRVDFSRATRLDLEKHARNHGPARLVVGAPRAATSHGR